MCITVCKQSFSLSYISTCVADSKVLGIEAACIYVESGTVVVAVRLVAFASAYV